MADSPEEKKERISTITAAVKKVIDSYAVGHLFYGNELKDDCVKLVPEYQDAYVDTFLKMARRHRRDSFIAVDHNNSLYKRVKSNIEILQEKIEQEKADKLNKKDAKKPEQLDLSFTHGFLIFFVVSFLVFFFVSGIAFGFFGGPKVTSFIASKSSSVYMPVGPMYFKGFIPFLCNRFFIASVDTLPPRALAISLIVISIPHYRYALYKNQVVKAPYSRIWDIYLYNCIAKNGYFLEIFENSFQNLDRSIGILYTFLMSRIWDTKNGIGETESLNGSKVAKGDFYERRTEKFSGMA